MMNETHFVVIHCSTTILTEREKQEKNAMG